MGKHRILSPGDTIEHLELLENLGYRKYCGENTTYWKCRCTRCGTIVEVPQKNLGKAQKDCGCGKKLPRSSIEIGATFGRLKVLSLCDSSPGRGYSYLCECSCENHTHVIVRGSSLRSGETKSCGCLHSDTARNNVKIAHEKNYVGGTSINKLLANDLQKNNTSGFRGVSWHRGIGKWSAQIAYKGTTYYLGYYENINDAADAVRAAREHILSDFEEWYRKLKNSSRNLICEGSDDSK